MVGNVESFLRGDATCPDIFAPSHLTHATLATGEVATTSCLVTHYFTPVAIEISGAIGPKSLEILKELSRRVRRHSGDLVNQLK